jgi:epoxyqueuosine reductase
LWHKQNRFRHFVVHSYFSEYMDKTQLTRQFKAMAKRLGFEDVKVAKAEFMEDEALRLENWLNKGYHGEMKYMEKHFDLRVDPTKLVPGAKSVVSLMYNYYSEEKQADPTAPKISMYAYGRDYHKVVKAKLKQLEKYLRTEVGQIQSRIFVDSAPVMERDWAVRSGLGWMGKHTLLLSPRKGSCFFLAELICDVEFEYDLPIKDYCGSCTRCIDACPTDAISSEGYLVDGSKCISYLTIELKSEIPGEFAGKMENWMFGCDICQQVCPWNRFSKSHEEPEFVVHPDLLQMHKSDWEALQEDAFEKLFQGSAVKRTGYHGLKRNIRFLKAGVQQSEEASNQWNRDQESDSNGLKQI